MKYVGIQTFSDDRSDDGTDDDADRRDKRGASDNGETFSDGHDDSAGAGASDDR